MADDDAAIRTVVRQALSRAGYEVKLIDTAAGLVKLIEEGIGDVVVTDVILPDANGLDTIPKLLALRPGLRVIVMSAQNTLSTAVRATEQGAFDYLPKPFDLNELIRSVAAALEGVPETADEPVLGGDETALIGRSAPMQEVYRLIARVVPNDLTVMILGESGTGKELVARAIHEMGARARRPFIAVNMAAIPRELIESELFGHERGAFTGAAARAAGKFEQAQGGTLFLDEIGDMPLELQAKLLRVLQSGEVTPVGGKRAEKVDVRIVAATHRDLDERVREGSFREDLLYRLRVVPLAIPPLRERPEDIPVLAEHFATRYAAELHTEARYLSDGCIEHLAAHDWPGNVRELENAIKRALVLASHEVLSPDDFAFLRGTAAPVAEGGSLEERILEETQSLLDAGEDDLHRKLLERLERPLLQAVLRHTGGNQLRAAAVLGINRNTLRKKISELGIAVPQRP
ncbi:nitrogen regulation protein NR(I) [Thiocapsa sp.]|uniref:nitrogen regulation protein NR(I) n=1 Tax=Thiocapsa sp. TaxID=2024551 RepID=UPI003593CD31